MQLATKKLGSSGAVDNMRQMGGLESTEVNDTMAIGEDADGGMTNEEFLFEQENEVEEPIFFDQTTRHIGSIQKNMVLTDSQRENGGNKFGRPGMATKALHGFNPASTMPNYSGIMGPGGQNQATYKNGLQGGNSVQYQQQESSYRVSEERIANQYADVDAPKGQDQMWQIIDTTGGAGTASTR